MAGVQCGYKTRASIVTEDHPWLVQQQACTTYTSGLCTCSQIISVMSNHLHTELHSNHPELYDLTCDCDLCTKLADKLDKRWRFVGHYLGLDNKFLSIANREGQTEVGFFHMLQKWQQQHYGKAASVAALVKIVCI